MGEQSVPPHENGSSKDEKPNGNDVEMDSGEEDDFDMSPEEFAKLDGQLDALNSALDDIEQKNDDIHAQLLQLLNANREIRQQLQQSNTTQETPKQ